VWHDFSFEFFGEPPSSSYSRVRMEMEAHHKHMVQSHPTLQPIIQMDRMEEIRSKRNDLTQPPNQVRFSVSWQLLEFIYYNIRVVFWIVVWLFSLITGGTFAIAAIRVYQNSWIVYAKCNSILWKDTKKLYLVCYMDMNLICRFCFWFFLQRNEKKRASIQIWK